MPPANQLSEPQWPPRSPHEALLSTPGGRDRLRRLANRTSPTPSPQKRLRTASALSSRSANLMAGNEGQMEEEEEEDEETLQLKLQEIQARLRLKKIQSAKAKITQDTETTSTRPESAPLTQGRPLRTASAVDRAARPSSQVEVQVPASPVRKAQPPPVQRSPSRVLLGIDKGLRGQDISLKRAPSLRRAQDGQDGQPTAGYLSRAKTPIPGVPQQPTVERPMSFNERLAASRADEVERQERQERIKRLRTNAFGIGQQEMEQYKSKAEIIPDEPVRAPQYSREEITSSLQRSNTVPSLRTQSRIESTTAGSTGSSQPAVTSRKTKAAPADVPEADASAFEPYSSIHLSQRILPHKVLTRHVSGKKVMNMQDLLKVVKSPDYQLPDIEQDIVVFAIVAKKSEPRSHKPSAERNGLKQEERGKYMVVTLVDLKWELELFLFNSGFTRFWKLTEGTVIAILNPTIMAPPKGRVDTGRFSLIITSDEDTLLEVGTARDLGFCKSVKKDGELCNSWVNKKRTEFCEFHTNSALQKQRSSRLELNMTTFGHGPGGKKKFNSTEVFERGEKSEKEKKRGTYDRETHSHWFASKSLSAADLIDGKNNAPGSIADRKEREESLKRRLAQKEHERGIMQRLGQIGNSAGREYMRRTESQAEGLNSSLSSAHPSSSSTFTDEPPRLDARALGLLPSSRKDQKIHLSPIKRKRAESIQSSSTAASTTAPGPKGGFGWGSNLKDKLTRMKDGENLRIAEQPPVRKKTRFVTEKGIREAGRESLGVDLSAPSGGDVFLDDDDELVILR